MHLATNILTLVLPLLLCHNQLVSSESKLTCQLMDDTSPGIPLTLAGHPNAPCRLSPAGFTILTGSPRQLLPYFKVRSPNSTLETAQLVDLERLGSETGGECRDRRLPNCTVSLTLINAGAGATRHVDVVILDRNDHGPQFSSPIFRIELSERRDSDNSNSKIDLPVATDADRQLFGILRYELQPSDTVFQLEELRRDPFSEPIPVLKQLRGLDREAQASYAFVLRAIDRGSPPLTGSTSVLISLADVNDNKPVFDRRVEYSAKVNESVAPGQTVLCVNATDLDENDYGRVRYRIKTPPGGELVRHFSISSVSGCISVSRQLDYESKKEFVFSVVASDSDRSPNSAEAEVKITIMDENDCHPEITIHSSVKEGVLEGNRTAEKLIAVATVTDDDSGPGGRVTCEAEPATKYRIELSTSMPSIYKLYLTAGLDREAASIERVKVCCTDHGTPPLRSCQNHSFKVKDINDEAPKFERKLYVATVTENISQTLLPFDVVKVTAIDRDEGPINNLVTYSIGSDISEYFYINNMTGMIRAWRPVDRETRTSFVCIVTAEDTGGLRDTATVSISVRDVNDNAPTLHYPNGQHLDVPENASLGTQVGQIEATDSDSGDFGQVHFVIIPDTQQSDWHDFRIDRRTGRIYTNRQLDRERQQVYQLRIRVIDHPNGGSRQQNSVTATVTVRILDVNDNSPEIQFPTLDNKTFEVSWQEPAFQPVLQVRAIDRDEAENGMLRFELLQVSSNSELFYIDPTDGKIRINRQMSESDLGDHRLTVRVSDSAIVESPRSSQIRLTIRVDRSAPKFLPAASVPPPHGGGSGGGGSGGGGQWKSPGGRGGGGGRTGFADDADGRTRSDGGNILVAAVAAACALTLVLLAVALCLCHRRGLFAELLGPTSQQQQQQQQQQRMRRKANGAETAIGGGQLESLAFLGSGSGRGATAREKSFPSVTSSLNQSEATAATFDETANYVTYGGSRMQWRGPKQEAENGARN